MNRQSDLEQEQRWRERADAAQGQAAHAFTRLLLIAEQSDTGQARRVASFLAASYNGEAFSFNLFDLRPLDVQISDDILACLDCLRWGKLDLYKLVPDGDKRMQHVVKLWGLIPW